MSCNGAIDGNCPSEREGNMCRVPGEGVAEIMLKVKLGIYNLNSRLVGCALYPSSL